MTGQKPLARGPLTVSIMLATSMYALDSTIANVALPHMQGSLSAAQDQITWVLTSFIVAQALATPVVGLIAERMGRRRLMLLSIIGFTLASAACGLATNLPEMVLFRVFQGFFGAAFIPLSQAILFDINPPDKHPQAMAIFGAGVVLGPVIGPALGGWLTDALSWRWVFYINLPVGLVAFCGVSVFMPEYISKSPRKFDYLGFGALALFIASLQIMLDRGPGEDWFYSWEIWIEVFLIISALYVFLINTIIGEKPFFDRELLNDRNFIVGCFISIVTGLMLYGTLALLPPLMQNLLGYPAVTAGIVTMPRGAGMFISMALSGRLMGRLDPRILLLVGFGLNALALWQMSGFALEMGPRLIIISGVLQGLGLGFVFVASNTMAFATVPAHLRTDGSAIFTLVRSLGSSIGISIMQALFLRNVQTSYSDLSQSIRPDNPIIGEFGGSLFGPDAAEALSAAALEVARQASMVAYVSDFYLAMLMALAVMPLILALRPRKNSSPEAPHVLD